ncbi:unnamed protein product [Cyprideis torosa]|uniref:Uncharacterized protein n=1 Tax=Cyprideis torosa TaxID=163714 RepID=A0A7R8W3P0_9CRUS|nr:unnamed protein product [Cyprideis torosa]CAG0881084.1 unnamed protein product [Cyprideis torosa]
MSFPRSRQEASVSVVKDKLAELRTRITLCIRRLHRGNVSAFPLLNAFLLDKQRGFSDDLKESIAAHLEKLTSEFEAYFDGVEPWYKDPFGAFVDDETEEAEELLMLREYIPNPLLMDGYKFDLRLYVLITSIAPLRLYRHTKGLTRISTVPYEKPTQWNFDNQFLHLTNYTLNKANSSIRVVDHKKDLSAFDSLISSSSRQQSVVWDSIDDVIVKTFLAVLPTLQKAYKLKFKCNDSVPVCFQVVGFDIILDAEFKPYVLEVNSLPSFAMEMEIDESVKVPMMCDTLRMICPTAPVIGKLFREQKRQNLGNRIHGRWSPPSVHYEKELAKWELKQIGGYKRIFPSKDESRNMYYAQLEKDVQNVASASLPCVSSPPLSEGFEPGKISPSAEAIRLREMQKRTHLTQAHRIQDAVRGLLSSVQRKQKSATTTENEGIRGLSENKKSRKLNVCNVSISLKLGAAGRLPCTSPQRSLFPPGRGLGGSARMDQRSPEHPLPSWSPGENGQWQGQQEMGSCFPSSYPDSWTAAHPLSCPEPEDDESDNRVSHWAQRGLPRPRVRLEVVPLVWNHPSHPFHLPGHPHLSPLPPPPSSQATVAGRAADLYCPSPAKRPYTPCSIDGFPIGFYNPRATPVGVQWLGTLDFGG